MHGTDVYVSIAGYLTDSSEKPWAVKVVAENEVTAGGHNINPVAVDPDNVRLAM